ncbi:MAG: PQQ-binding-like beta-propeller repeat protein [Rubripirellula sp.]|nr:PQQ-binding-like beta-propeller repeat protein [Rubripirellula sp.]
MIRSTALGFILIASGMASISHASDLMTPDIMRQLGLTQSWARPIPVPAGAQTIADQQLHVHEEDPREYVELVEKVKVPAAGEAAPAEGQEAPAPKVIARIAADRLGMDGQPIGRKEAERLASNEIRRLKRRGIDAELNYRTVPRINLYSISTDGTLDCRDAETGEPIWMVGVGDRRLPYGALGTSEKFITVINGSNLYTVESATGEVIEDVDLIGAPSLGAINSGRYAMVPMIGSGVAGYPLAEPDRMPFKEIVVGEALALPTKAPKSTRIAWGTDRSFVYVMEMQGKPTVMFRLKTDGIVSGRIATATGNRFFFGSENGQVYALLGTRTGRVLWTIPFGEPFYNEPVVIGEQVLIRSSYGTLYSLDINNGALTWQKPVSNANEMIAAFGGKLYMTTLSGGLSVIELETGNRIATYNHIRPTKLLVNRITNRLYLVSDSGEVQCLRDEAAELPTFNVQPKLRAAEEPAAAAPAQNQPSNDPFGGGGGAGAAGNDPFGGGGGGGNDPFGGGGAAGADPVGGGGAAGADPFGGGGDAGADPFGGNPF